ncbi:MAG TPA: hypothetical protein DCZ41_02625 [Firmicutes bacterium]|nr:hypothetical protein [Bacillota bacterium]
MNKTRFHRLNIALTPFFIFGCFSCSSSVEGLSIEEAKAFVSSFGELSCRSFSYQTEINCLGLGTEKKSLEGEAFVDSKKVDDVSIDSSGNKTHSISYLGDDYSRSPYFGLPLHLKEESFYVLDEDGKLLSNDCSYGLIYTTFIDDTTLARLLIKENEEGGLTFYANDSDKYTIFNGAYEADIIAIAHFNFAAIYDKNGFLIEESAVSINYQGKDTKSTIRAKTTFTYAFS